MSCLTHAPVNCQFLGEPIQALEKLWREKRVCACGRHVIDAFGDHVHACKKHTGSRKAAHETILDAIEAICWQAGITTEQRNIPSIKKRNDKMGRGDLVLKNINLGGHLHLVILPLCPPRAALEPPRAAPCCCCGGGCCCSGC
jgi:hypothetical protein